MLEFHLGAQKLPLSQVTVRLKMDRPWLEVLGAVPASDLAAIFTNLIGEDLVISEPSRFPLRFKLDLASVYPSGSMIDYELGCFLTPEALFMLGDYSRVSWPNPPIPSPAVKKPDLGTGEILLPGPIMAPTMTGFYSAFRDTLHADVHKDVGIRTEEGLADEPVRAWCRRCTMFVVPRCPNCRHYTYESRSRCPKCHLVEERRCHSCENAGLVLLFDSLPS